MKRNSELRIHIINVGHGDSVLLEFPDDHDKPRFGLIDAGGLDPSVEHKTLNYLNAFIECRLGDRPSVAADSEDYVFEFVCLTHPHLDHYLGLLPVLEAFCGDQVPRRHKPRQFWDCGFRYNTGKYLGILDFLGHHPEVQFLRVASGSEFHFGDVEVLTLAPSIDLRNRYDTWGVNVNNASIVLRVTRGEGVAILAADAQFDTWGKICEEFPREKHIVYPKVKRGGKLKPDRRDPEAVEIAFLSQENQLECDFLKVAHHGSMHGTTLEYLEKLSPTQYAISCDVDSWYQAHRRSWKGKFPHPLARFIIGTAEDVYDVASPDVPSTADLSASVWSTAEEGSMVYTIRTSGHVSRRKVKDKRDKIVTAADLDQHL